jgi:hypothetical protein
MPRAARERVARARLERTRLLGLRGRLRRGRRCRRNMPMRDVTLDVHVRGVTAGVMHHLVVRAVLRSMVTLGRVVACLRVMALCVVTLRMMSNVMSGHRRIRRRRWHGRRVGSGLGGGIRSGLRRRIRSCLGRRIRSRLLGCVRSCGVRHARRRRLIGRGCRGGRRRHLRHRAGRQQRCCEPKNQFHLLSPMAL